MTKADIVNILAEKDGLPKADAQGIVETIYFILLRKHWSLVNL
jgi:nucleoid DNA-binding protein